MNTEDLFLPSRNISLPINGQSTANAYSTFSETALGIIPGSFANLIALLLPNKLNEVVNGLSNQNLLANQIFVCGLVPGTTGYMCGKVFIGDWIIAINKLPSTLEGFEGRIKRALMDNESTLELTVRSLKIDVITKFFARSNTSDVVIKFGENSHWSGLCNSLSLFPFGVMFIPSERDGQSSSSYCHPLSDKQLTKALDIILPTLQKLSDDFCLRSTISCLQLVLRKEALSLSIFNADDRGWILLAVPSRVADRNMCERALQIITRVTAFYFGSYDRAFRSADASVNDEIDRLISVILFELLCPDLLFEEMQMSTDMSWTMFQTKFLELPFLTLPETVKVSVDSLLTDFESSDFSNPFLIPPRRRYTIIGSCLFFKGFLVASHVNTTDLIDIGLFLRHRLILAALSFSPQMATTLCGTLFGGNTNTEGVSSPRGEQSVVWCEVFPSHRYRFGEGDEEPSWPTFGYNESPSSRYVLLVVPKKQTYVAVLLETASVVPESEALEPDFVVVREVGKLLGRLDNIGLLAFCEQSLGSSLGVKLTSADSAFPTSSMALRSSVRRSKSGGIALQALAVTNAKRFSIALKGFLGSDRKTSFTSQQAQYIGSDVTVEATSEDGQQLPSISTTKPKVTSKISNWLGDKLLCSRQKYGSDELLDIGDIDFDAAHYVESRQQFPNAKESGEKVGVPGSYAASGTMTSSEGPGRDEGIPLPLANTLPTLYDMSESHLQTGDIATGNKSMTNRGGMQHIQSIHQEIMYECPGKMFGFVLFDLNQGIYVCPTDTYSPVGSSMLHHRAIDTFLRSTACGVDMFESNSDLEEASFLFPSDPVDWFDSDVSLSLLNWQKNKKRNDLKISCGAKQCSSHQDGEIASDNTDLDFSLNPSANASQSYWCTIKKFPSFGANSNTRMFAICGDENAASSTLDLGLQFAFDIGL